VKSAGFASAIASCDAEQQISALAVVKRLLLVLGVSNRRFWEQSGTKISYSFASAMPACNCQAGIFLSFVIAPLKPG